MKDGVEVVHLGGRELGERVGEWVVGGCEVSRVEEGVKEGVEVVHL